MARPALYSRPVADLPIDLDAGLSEQLARVLDVEGKIPRALEALGPVAGRDVILVDGPGGIRARQLTELGARVTLVDSSAPLPFDAPEQLAEAARVLRPGGRLLVVHDYGRDDVSVLRGPLPEHGPWSRPDGPFLGKGFKIRVIHCWWTYDSIESARSFLADAFGIAGTEFGAELTRPRLSYNVAVYHRTLGEEHP